MGKQRTKAENNEWVSSADSVEKLSVEAECRW